MRFPFPSSLAAFALVAFVPVACGSSGSPGGAAGSDGGASSGSGGGGADAGGSSSGTGGSSSGAAGLSSGSGGSSSGATSSSGAGAGDAGSTADGASSGGSSSGGGGDAATDGPAAGAGPYGGDGPSAYTTASLSVPSPSGAFTTTAYVPSASGAAPVVILSSGFFQTAAAYAPYAKRLASWGVVTLLRDDPNLGETTPSVVSDVEYEVTTWLAATNADSTSALHGKVDVTRVGLAGHSRGGQIAFLAGEGLAGKVKGVFGLDPVDTAQSAGDPEARTTLASIGVPVAFIGETTDGAASGCAPATDDFQVLYQAASSPAVAITAVNADHTMFEDPASCSFCTLCTKGTANAATVLAASVKYLTAFFARELLGDASVGAAFQGAGAAHDEAAGTIELVSK